MTACRCRCHMGGAYVSCDVGSPQPGGILSCTTEHGTEVRDERAVSPCGFPRCRDIDGNPRLTTDTFCPACQKRYRHVLDWIAEDYDIIRATMPMPVGMKGGRRGKAVSFGHPAAWASDMLALIAEVLNAVESNLREHNNHGDAPARTVAEQDRVDHAVRYLSDRFGDLCSFPDAESCAEELVELHRTAYTGLGRARFAEKLPIPCPDCDTLQMVREVGQVQCQECGLRFSDDQYPRLALIIADDVRRERDRQLDEYAARHAEAAVASDAS